MQFGAALSTTAALANAAANQRDNLSSNQPVIAILTAPTTTTSGIAIATDTTRFSLSLKNDSDSSEGEELAFVQTKTDVVMFTHINQTYGISGGGMIVGEEDSELSEEDDIILLHKGKFIADTGTEEKTVVTENGTVVLPPNSAALIESQPGKPLKVLSLGSGGNDSVLVKPKHDAEQKLRPGQQIITSSRDLLDEEYIPTSGTEGMVSGAINKASPRTVRTSMNLRQLASYDIMVAGSLVHIGQNASGQKRFRNHIVAGITQQEQSAQGKTQEIINNILVSAQNRHGNQFSNSAKAYGPVRVLCGANSQVVSAGENHLILKTGELFIRATENMQVDAGSLTVHINKGDCASVTRSGDLIRVRACTGISGLGIQVAGRSFHLHSGQELTVSDHALAQKDLTPNDHIGRRNFHRFSLPNGKSAAISDFSVMSVIMNTPYLASISHPKQQADQHTLDQLLKTQVALQLVTGNRGKFITGKPDGRWSIGRSADKSNTLCIEKRLKPVNTFSAYQAEYLRSRSGIRHLRVWDFQATHGYVPDRVCSVGSGLR